MNKKRHLLLSAVLATTLAANAQVTINVDASNPGVKVSPNLYGIFFEDINHAADGGLYAELISNRSFEDDEKNIPTWKTSAQEGAKIQTQLINKGLLNKAQGKALQLTIAAKPAATASLINEGFWGINAVQGRTYKLSFWAKGSYKGGLKARLTNAKGDKVYAETSLNAKVGKKWTKYTAELTANANDAKAQFELVADGKGTIVLDVVSLFPPTFNNRENGLRPDLAQLLYNIHPKFVRFPGGCYVEGQESPENAFHWEKTIGPIEERPGHKNVNWRYRTSDGMGFDEYLQLAEDLKQQAHKLEAIKAEAVKKGEALNGIVLTIAAKVSATGQLYGSVNAATVAEELAKKGIEVDRKIITMKDAKKVGEYEATVHYHKEVEVKVPVNVVAENAPVAAPAAEEVAAEAVAEEEAPAAE